MKPNPFSSARGAWKLGRTLWLAHQPAGFTCLFVKFRNPLTDWRIISVNYPGSSVALALCFKKDHKAWGTSRLNCEMSLAKSQSSQLPELIIELGVAGARPLWYKKILWKAKGGDNNNSHPILFLSIIYSKRHWWWTNIETGIQWGHTGALEASDAVSESGNTMRQCFSCLCILHLPLSVSLSLSPLLPLPPQPKSRAQTPCWEFSSSSHIQDLAISSIKGFNRTCAVFLLTAWLGAGVQ